MKAYDHKKIEGKWQKKWAKDGLYRSVESATKKKCFVLDMFPYPSGEGLHVGHPKGYIATDIYSRMKRMQGHAVLHPMGFDAFGLPAENYAIKNKVNPKVAVAKNVKRFKGQLEHLGFDYDWNREVNTTDPEYYRWTQWIFLQLLKKGLAYESNEPINWCPSCKTGLANEDLEDGKCERCGSVVEKKPLRQWVLAITQYADRLLTDLNGLDWPEHIKESQRNWIGRSEGSLLTFPLVGRNEKIEVFTTRPDTLFGVTYVVLAPEHPLVATLSKEAKNGSDVVAYVAAAAKKSEIERTDAKKEKTGVRIEGVLAVNPVNKEQVPVFVADYVLAHYGTGAVMAVPAHDERDFAFAKKYNLPIKTVIEPLIVRNEGTDAVKPALSFSERRAIVCILKHATKDEYLLSFYKKNGWKGFIVGGIEDNESLAEAGARELREETGYRNVRFIRTLGVVHSKFFHEVKQVNRFAHFEVALFELTDEAREEVSPEEQALHEVVWVPRIKVAETVNRADIAQAWAFHERGECMTGDGILVGSGELSGKTSAEAMVPITKLAGGSRTVNYRLKDWVFSRQRYWGEPIPVVHCEKCGVVPVPEKDLPVKLPNVESYEPTGTGESPLAAISRWVNTKCPTCGGKAKRETNTMPQWAGSSWYYLRYMDPTNSEKLVGTDKEHYWTQVDMYVGGAEHATRHLIYARFWHKFLYDIGVVSTTEPFKKLHSVGLIMGEDGRKMSKRFGNVVDPDTIVETVGADSLRLYEAFMGPFGDAISWSTDSLAGARRFIERVWRLQSKASDAAAPLSADGERELHKTIKKVGDDIEGFRFNTAVSALMVLSNTFEKETALPTEAYRAFIRLLAPFAPHVAEELWSAQGGQGSVHMADWPTYDAAKVSGGAVRLAVQVNGKVRAEFVPTNSANEEAVKQEALALPDVQKWIAGKVVAKVILVKGKLVSIVVSA